MPASIEAERTEVTMLWGKTSPTRMVPKQAADRIFRQVRGRRVESNDITREVSRAEKIVNWGPSMSLLHAPPLEVLSCYAGADKQFRVENEFECPCDVCDRLWFKNNIKKCQMNVSPFWLKGLVRDRIL